MEKIPYTLAAVRMDKVISDCFDDMKKINLSLFSQAVVHEIRTVRDALSKCVQYGHYNTDREPNIESARLIVYNACAMFIYLGSFEDVKDLNDELDCVEAMFYELKKFLEEYPSEIFEPRWFSCKLCGKECQLYVQRDDIEQMPWNEVEDVPAVKEFKNISHVCDKCWQHYIWEK